jgi:hypothetical protein
MRYVGIERAQLLHMIDLDGALFVEYDGGTKKPLALIETARDVGQAYKCATVTANLARRARLPCYWRAVHVRRQREPCRRPGARYLRVSRAPIVAAA